MSTPMYLFTGFITLGMVFYFTGCFLAARPASGTTEWINYKCGRKFTFCPEPKPLTKFDIIPIIISALAALGIGAFNDLFITHTALDIPYLASFLDIPLFSVGLVYIYSSHLTFVVTIPLLYVFIKNLTGGYLIPISGIVLTLLDGIILLSIGNFSIIFANFFVLIALYLAYRYTTSSKKLYLPFIGIALSIGMVFSASVSLAVFGILAVFIVKEIALFIADTDKKQTATRTVLFTLFCIMLPAGIYITAVYFDLTKTFISQLNIFDVDLLSELPLISLMVSVGGLMALPCCIYQAVKAKDGRSLFAVISYVIYILSILIFGANGLLSMLALPVIVCSFTALHNRKLKGWIIAYLVTAALYISSILIFTLV